MGSIPTSPAKKPSSGRLFFINTSMKYHIPDNVRIIEENERDNFDQYMMLPGETHCHHIEVRPDAKLVMQMTMIQPYELSQDNTLRCWFSLLPLGETAIRTPPFDKFVLRRVAFDVILDTTKLEGGKYFLNIQNLQNSPNAYELIFTYE